MARTFSSKIEEELGFGRIQRIKWKRFALGGAIMLVIAIILIPFVIFNQPRIRTSALAQAEQARKNHEPDLALRHLDKYLVDNPEDIKALDLKAKILSEVYLPWGQLIEASKTLDQLIRLDPKGEGRLETRRKLAEFYIQFSDELKRVVELSNDPDQERQQSRYVAAASIANQLVEEAAKGKYQDAVAHRLLARACEGQISEIRGKESLMKGLKKGDSKQTEGEIEDLRLRAIKNYAMAINLDPHDLESPTRLANLYWTWSKDRASADAVLDAMLKANPNSVEARLARYRAFSATDRKNLAQDELKAVLALAPDNTDVRIEVASVALSQRDTAEARRQLEAIPASGQDDLRVKILRGYMEFAELHPNDAIDQWRRGLMIVGGTNQDLTWKLAFQLIQLGRYVEADPLRQQYNRLAKGDKNGMGRFLDALFDMGYGRLYEARKKLEKIKEVVQPSIKTDVMLALGRCCDMMGDSDGALLAYRNAASSSPSSAAPRLAIARHLQKRHPEEAIEEIGRALDESPNEIYLLLESIRLRLANYLGRKPLDAKQARELEDLLDRAQAVAPNNPLVLASRAEFLSITGQLPRAVELLAQEVKGEARKIPEIWMSLSLGLERLNRRAEALQVLDQASAAENAGDRVKLRIAKARLLARSGKGQAARDVLSKNTESVSLGERPELLQTLGELLRELGDREGAIAAYSEWARLSPKVPGPALALLAMAQVDNDDRAAKRGLEALKEIGGDREPYGIAARALELLRKDPSRPGPPPADRLYEAEILVKTLRQEVPSLRFGSLLEGMIQEYRGNLEAAVKAYKTAQKDDINSPALPRLIEAYLKLKRFDELERLRQDFDKEVEARQQPGLSAEFDRMAAAASLKLGDRDRAEYFASKMLEGRRDDVSARVALARMLESNNEPQQAEESLQALVKEKPNDPTTWFILILFQVSKRTPADVARTIGQARREYQGERPELFLAQCYFLGKDLPNAKAAYKKAVEARPDDTTTLRALAEFYVNSNQEDQVDPILRKVLKLDPTTTWAARLLAMRLTTRPDPATWKEAYALVAPGASASGDTPEDRLVRAIILARSPENNRRMEAVPAFVSLANDLPVSSPLAIETRLKLSQAMIEANQFAMAWDAIRPIADNSSPPNSGALVLAIEALARTNRPAEAELRLERLAAIDPKSPEVRLSKAWILIVQGKKAEAIAALEAAVDEAWTGPNARGIALTAFDRMVKFGDPEALLKLARMIADRWPAEGSVLAKAHFLRNEYDEVLAASEKGIEAGASPGESLQYAMAAAAARKGDVATLKRVAELGEKAKAKAPRDVNVRISLATIHHLQNRYEEELASYREALDLSPINVQFLNNMAWTLCEALQKPDEAMKCIDDAIRREGEAAPYLDTRGVIEERLGQFDRAVADLEKSIAIEKSAKVEPTAATYFHLARAYLKAGNTAASRKSREAALKAKFVPADLDPTDRRDLDAVMNAP